MLCSHKKLSTSLFSIALKTGKNETKNTIYYLEYRFCHENLSYIFYYKLGSLLLRVGTVPVLRVDDGLVFEHFDSYINN